MSIEIVSISILTVVEPAVGVSFWKYGAVSSTFKQ
jgi:hypothetical protein